MHANRAALALGFASVALFALAMLFQPGDTTPVQVPSSALHTETGTLLTRPSRPVRLKVPQLGIDVPVKDVGLTRQGSMGIPSGAWEVGWFAPGFRPGEQGNAVMAGHLDTAFSGPAVFWKLQELEPGAEVHVTDASGSVLLFRVVRSDVYPLNAAPMEEIFGTSSGRTLRLITCDGAWMAEQRLYSDRLVVTAEFVRKTESGFGTYKKAAESLTTGGA